MIGRFVVSVCVVSALMVVVTGCQKLFQGQDALLQGQTVTVSVKVPETPPPAATPAMSPPKPQPVPVVPPASTVLDSRLLPGSGSTVAEAPRPVDDLHARLPEPPAARNAIVHADSVMHGKTVSEDLTLRGTVLVRGSLVVAPHATLRLEPGARILFAPAVGSREKPSLVVLGRLLSQGTAQKPVLLGAAFDQPVVGDWNGVVLISTEKKNSLDHCLVEGALTGVTARYSQFSGTGLKISRCLTGMALYDSVVTLTRIELQRCDTGIRLSDSEMEIKDGLVRENRLGVLVVRSSLVAAGLKLQNNSQEGMVLDQARFRISGSTITENRNGLHATGGEGQILLSRFIRNRERGAVLQDIRIRISDSVFVHNGAVGLQVENTRGSAIGCSFSGNGKHQLQHGGTEPFSALLNWWGTADESSIAAAVDDAFRSQGRKMVEYVPFLAAPPANLP